MMENENVKGRIRVVYCDPGRLARTVEIGTELVDLQRAVGGGLIEPYYPFGEPVCIVCNDEGKFNGMRPNRAVRNEDGRIEDIIFGPFFICDCSTENFGSLSEEQLKRYSEQFRYPEHFFRDVHTGEIKAVRYDPTKGREHSR